MVRQIVFGGTTDALSAADVTQRLPFWGYSGVQTALIAVPVPAACTIRNLNVHLRTAPGGAASRRFAIYKNEVVTALDLTLSGASTDGLDSDEVTCVAGDYLMLETDPTSNPTGSLVDVSLEVEFDNADHAVLWGAITPVQINATAFGNSYGLAASSINVDLATTISPIAGTLLGMWAHQQSPADGHDMEYYVNGTERFNVLLSGATENGDDQTPVSATLNIGDSMYLVDNPQGFFSAGTNPLGVALLYTPAFAGESMLTGSWNDADPGGTSYNVTGRGGGGDASPSVFVAKNGPTAWNAGGLLIGQQSALAGDSRTLDFFVNGAQATQTVTVTGAVAVFNQDTTNVDEVAADATWQIRKTETTTAGGAHRWSLIQNVAASNPGAPQLVFGGPTDVPSAGGVRYGLLMGDGLWSTAIVDVQAPIPVAGVLDALRIRLAAAPGAGNSYEFTVMKNGVATALTVTVSDTDTEGEYTGGGVHFAVGDLIAMRSTPTSVPTTSLASWGARWMSDDGVSMIWLGGRGSPATGAVEHNALGATASLGWTTEPNASVLWGTPCTVTALYAVASVAPGAGTSRAQRIMVEGAAVGSDATIADAATAANATGMSVAVAAGDLISLRSTPSGTPAASRILYSIAYVPTTAGQSNLSGRISALQNAGAAVYYTLQNARDVAGNTTEATLLRLASAASNAEVLRLVGWRVLLDAAPGGVATRTMSLRKGGADQLSVTFSGAEVEESNPGTVDFVHGDTFSVASTITGAPAGSGVARWTISIAGPVSATAVVSGTVEPSASEEEIRAGGQTIIITLTDAIWVAAGAAFDAVRQAIIDGLDSAQAEAAGWNAEVRDALDVSAVVRTSDTVVTITLPAFAAYAITAAETITVTVPDTATDAATTIVATPTFEITLAAPSAAVSGTVVPTATEVEIFNGGQTIIVTLTDTTWVAAGATFDAIRQDILDGLDSAQSEPEGWNAQVRDLQPVTTVVRTSDTVVTITLDPASGYDITATETITVTVPDSAIDHAGALVATPTFAVTHTTVLPGPPTNPTPVDPGVPGCIDVYFDPPADDGGCAITEYCVYIEQGANSFVVCGPSSPIRVCGLLTAEPYTICVAATNCVGEGPCTAPGGPIPVIPPPPPTNPDSPAVPPALAGQYGAVALRYRFEQRDHDYNLQANLDGAVFEASIDLDNDRPVVRTARFLIDALRMPDGFDPADDHIAVSAIVVARTYGNDLAGRPVWVASEVVIPMGLYHLDAPSRQFTEKGDDGEAHEFWEVEASDLTVHLLTAKTPEPYFIAAGADYIDEVIEIIEDLDLRHNLSSYLGLYTTPVSFIWAPGTSYLQIVNDLLFGINYYPIWPDAEGIFITRPRLNYDVETYNIAYTTAIEPRMAMSPFERMEDRSRYANRIVVVIDDPRRPAQYALRVNTDPTSPISTVSLGVVNTDPPISGGRVDTIGVAESIAEFELRDRAARALPANFRTFADPRRSPHEFYLLLIAGVEDETLWRVDSWKLELKTGAVMEHRLGRVGRIGEALDTSIVITLS